MNSSEALKARRDAERAERRRSERLQERADEQAEREREEARAEERRREEARDEAAARAAEDRARERRQERLLQLRQARVASARQDRKLGERRLLAKRELEDTRRAEVARERAGEQRRTDAADRAATAQRVEQREAEARTKRLDEQRAERRQAELRKSDTERRASERQGEQAEAERREQQLEDERRRLREERGTLEQRSGDAQRLRAEAASRAQEARRRDQLAADRRAELRRAARTARLRELAERRAAAEAASERAAELRAQQAARRRSERRDRERTVAAGSERRAEHEATELPWLRTEDGELVAWGGERVLLRGVAAVGLDEAVAGGSPLREALALDDRSLEQLSERWGANLVRLPFAAETIPGADLTELDELIGALAAAGSYTLLALESPEAGGQTPLPSAETHTAWRLLADRYQAEPGVLFELYAAAAPLAAGWPAAALELIRTVRSRHQSSLLLLPELGGELGAVHNLVYTIRLAPGSPSRLDERLTALATREAVLVSDWREDGVDPAGPATATAGLLEAHRLSWCAGYWNAHPRLVADAAAGRLTETRFGLAVRRALATPGPPALTPF